MDLTFDVWKLRLQEDCEREDKLLAYSSLGDECLRVLGRLELSLRSEPLWMEAQKLPRGTKVVHTQK